MYSFYNLHAQTKYLWVQLHLITTKHSQKQTSGYISPTSLFNDKTFKLATSTYPPPPKGRLKKKNH